MSSNSFQTAVVIVAVVLSSCGKPPPTTRIDWAIETSESEDDLRAYLRLSHTSAKPGQPIHIELELINTPGNKVETPEFPSDGLDLVDAITHPTRLESENSVHRYSWVVQAGPPAELKGKSLVVAWNPVSRKADSEQAKVTLSIPTITIHSAFSDGQFTDKLPPVGDALPLPEESDAP